MDKRSLIIKILNVIIVLLLIAIVVIIFKKGKPLNTNGKVVKDLYSYVGNNNLEKCGGLVFYSDEEINYDKLSDETKLCLAYTKVNDEDKEELKVDKAKKGNTCSLKDSLVFATDNYEDKICTLSKTNKDLVNENYKNMFGKEITSYDKFQLDNTTICYYDEDNYYCGLSEKYTYTIGAEPHTYRTIKSAYKKGEEIVIYDYFLRTINDNCFTSYMKDEKDETCGKALENKKEVDYKFLKKYGTRYVHTFKKSGDSYYWVSSKNLDK